MEVLLLGGSNFIGLALTQALLAEGHHVTWLNRGQSPVAISLRVSLIQADRNDAKGMCAALAGVQCDVVIDLSGYTPAQIGPVLAAFSNRPLVHYLFCSSFAVYQGFSEAEGRGSQPWGNYFHIPITEEHEQRPRHTYGRDKLACEKLLLEASIQQRFPVTIFRLPPVYGPWDYKCREWFYLRRIRELEAVLLPEGGHNLIHHVYVGDLAKRWVKILGRSASYGQIYNLATDEPVTLNRFITEMARAMGSPVQIVALPEVQAREFFGDQYLLHWPYLHRYHVVIDTRKIRQIIPEQYTLSQALEETVRWYVQVGEEWLRQRSAALAAVNDPSIGVYALDTHEQNLHRERLLLESIRSSRSKAIMAHREEAEHV